MNGFPYIFTFYSFKGGVGRSMALLNTAYTLASWGKHVLMVDMDLEAPGISGFLDRHNELTPTVENRRPDILSLLSEVATSLRAGQKPADIIGKLPPLDQYLRAVRPEKLAPIAPKAAKPGRLDIVPVDMSRDWCTRVSSLGLSTLSRDELLSVSSILHHVFKRHRFPFRPLGLEDFDPDEITPYDYVLVDSRTGITEIGGLCVGPLADRLVVLSSLNDQNVEGTRAFLNEAGIKTNARIDTEEPWDAAVPPGNDDPPSLGPKPTLLVASPVPVGELGLKTARLAELGKRIGIEPLLLSYHPQLALLETVFSRDFPREYLSREYLVLADAVTRLVNDHPAQIRSKLLHLQMQDSGNAAEGFSPHNNQNDIRLYDDALDHNNATSLALMLALRAITQNFEVGVSTIVPIMNRFKPITDHDFMITRRACAALAFIDEYRFMALGNWGTVLMRQAATKRGAVADKIYDAACGKFSQAVKLHKDRYEVFYNWGNALANQAKNKAGEEAKRLFVEAAKRFAMATKIAPKVPEILYNWANMLAEQAGKQSGAESDRLYAEACQKYSTMIKIKPDAGHALFNWGTALLKQAQTKTGSQALHLYGMAAEKYQEAARVQPNYYKAFINYAHSLIGQARLLPPGQESELINEARESLVKAEHMKPGSAAFSLSCLEAQIGDAEKSLKWLANAVEHFPGLSQEILILERDFDPIRSHPAFINFLRTLPQNGDAADGGENFGEQRVKSYSSAQ